MNSRPWRDAATVACQKSGIYPSDLIPQPDWDELPTFSGTIPYLILRVTQDLILLRRSGPIPGNIKP